MDLVSTSHISDTDLYHDTMKNQAKLMEVSDQLQTLTEEIIKLSTTNDEKFTSQFFRKIVLHAENFQLFENRQLAVLILAKLCTLLLGARKSKT